MKPWEARNQRAARCWVERNRIRYDDIGRRFGDYMMSEAGKAAWANVRLPPSTMTPEIVEHVRGMLKRAREEGAT